MIRLETLEQTHDFEFPELFKKLFEAEMTNWMRGFDAPLAKDKTWAEDVYPSLKENPPLLLHSGGFDFELMTPQEMQDFSFPETWDTEGHHFVPFAKTAEGNIYAFYPTETEDNEIPIVLIWQDDESEYVAKNFEDFIFRMMLEVSHDIDKDDLHADYGKENPMEAFRSDLLSDLKSITPYLKAAYVTALQKVYQGEIRNGLISYTLESERPLKEMIAEYLDFPQRGKCFEHEED